MNKLCPLKQIGMSIISLSAFLQKETDSLLATEMFDREYKDVPLCARKDCAMWHPLYERCGLISDK